MQIPHLTAGLFAEKTGRPELEKMARRIQDRPDGIVPFRTFRNIGNADGNLKKSTKQRLRCRASHGLNLIFL